jgi:hypothetical protein
VRIRDISRRPNARPRHDRSPRRGRYRYNAPDNRRRLSGRPEFRPELLRRRMEPEAHVVTVFPNRMERYFNIEIFRGV